jgi:hypothetical protein
MIADPPSSTPGRGTTIGPPGRGRHRAAAIGVLLLTLAGLLRALARWSHDPLYAYANSYDQTRYSACFDLYPDRPASIPPRQNSPEAPYARFRFVATGEPMCYGSSELAFQGIVAAVWRVAEAFGAASTHSVRGLGALHLLALLALSIALSRAWLRRGDSAAAVANAALLPLVFADPGNTLYLDTFYAEWTALLAAYATIALALLWRDEPVAHGRFRWLALAAFALATSKLQHLLLPLVLAAVVAGFDGLRAGRARWRFVALCVGGVAGLGVQAIQLSRAGAMMDTIRQYNAADVVFTGLLPFADDPRALLGELEIDPACAEHVGEPAWRLPDLPDRACPGLEDFGRGRELMTLLRHPAIAAGLAAHGVFGLDPWLARNIGHVEGETFGRIPV